MKLSPQNNTMDVFHEVIIAARTIPWMYFQLILTFAAESTLVAYLISHDAPLSLNDQKEINAAGGAVKKCVHFSRLPRDTLSSAKY